MHELSIATALIEQILEIAESNGLKRVDEVELETGVLRQVVPEVMFEAYKEVTRDTLAEGSTLKIKEVEAQARCRNCSNEFVPEINDFLCPDCVVADVDVLKGNEIILRSVSCESR